MPKQTKILCILDGFGLSAYSPNNCAALSRMPNFRRLLKDYWWSTMQADGEDVGQEDGLVGNSEVGHMNIGGLKLVPQLSYQITNSSANNFDLDKATNPDQLFDPKLFLKQKWQNTKNKTIHLAGLFSRGRIHSDLRHWAGAINAAGLAGATKIVMHIISDGRDSDRQSLMETWNYFVETYSDQIKPFENIIFLGSLGGRFYAMDRDKNADRIARGILPMFKSSFWIETSHLSNEIKSFLKEKYNVDKPVFKDTVDGQPADFLDNYFETTRWNYDYQKRTIIKNNFPRDLLSNFDFVQDLISNYTDAYYKREVYDEHIPAQCFTENFEEKFQICPNDTVWLINFRTDRMKQFTSMLCDINKEFELNLSIISNNSYGVKLETFLTPDLEFDEVRNRFKHMPEYNYEPGMYFPIFKTQSVSGTLAEAISKLNQTQLHIAETEKYNHVTYFLNGGAERKWPGEEWVVIPSNKVNSHAELPHMKAEQVTDYILDSGIGKHDYIVVNYANPDMLGHTGNIPACVESMEFLDEQLGRLLEVVERDNHQMIVIADHGNIEVVGENQMNGKTLIDTEHNASPVPFLVVSPKFKNDNLDLKINKESLIQKMQELSNQNITRIDLDKLQTVLSQNNQIDISEQWLTNEQIPTSILPLWYSGSILLGL